MKIHPADHLGELVCQRVEGTVRQHDLAIVATRLEAMASEHLEERLALLGPRGAIASPSDRLFTEVSAKCRRHSLELIPNTSPARLGQGDGLRQQPAGQ